MRNHTNNIKIKKKNKPKFTYKNKFIQISKVKDSFYIFCQKKKKTFIQHIFQIVVNIFRY